MLSFFSDYYLVLPVAAAVIFMAVMIGVSIEDSMRRGL